MALPAQISETGRLAPVVHCSKPEGRSLHGCEYHIEHATRWLWNGIDFVQPDKFRIPREWPAPAWWFGCGPETKTADCDRRKFDPPRPHTCWTFGRRRGCGAGN